MFKVEIMQFADHPVFVLAWFSKRIKKNAIQGRCCEEIFIFGFHLNCFTRTIKKNTSDRSMNFKTAEEKFIVNTFNVAFSSYLVLQYLALKGRGHNFG